MRVDAARSGPARPFFRSRWVEAPAHVRELDPTALPAGFRAGAAAAGLRQPPGLDVGVLFSEPADTTSAGRFTSSSRLGAPVIVSKESALDRLRAVVANAGGSNTGDGQRGIDTARATQEAAAAALGIAPDRTGISTVYDVCHNIAKFETFAVDGQARRVCVHRKGATRAFPPGSPEIPKAYREVGQPVFIPGSMGTASFVLAGRPGAMEKSFGTVCHGAGRALSRSAAKQQVDGATLRRELEAAGITVRSPSPRGLAEEAPVAYKDVERVVEVVERAGLAVRVVRLRPIGVVKG
jgi:hypothetical protein